MSNGNPDLKELLKLVPPKEHAAFTSAFNAWRDLDGIVNRETETPSDQAQKNRDLNEALARLNEALSELAEVRNS